MQLWTEPVKSCKIALLKKYIVRTTAGHLHNTGFLSINATMRGDEMRYAL